MQGTVLADRTWRCDLDDISPRSRRHQLCVLFVLELALARVGDDVGVWCDVRGVIANVGTHCSLIATAKRGRRVCERGVMLRYWTATVAASAYLIESTSWAG